MSVAHQYEFAGVLLHGLQFISCFGGGAAMVGRPAAGPAASKKLVGRREADHASIEAAPVVLHHYCSPSLTSRCQTTYQQ